VDKGIVEGGEDTGNAEDELACSMIVSKSSSILHFFCPSSLFCWSINFEAGAISRKTIKIIPTQIFLVNGLSVLHTIAGRGAQGDVLLRSGDLLGRHFEVSATSGFSSRGC
jgi:hypothetical protein